MVSWPRHDSIVLELCEASLRAVIVWMLPFRLAFDLYRPPPNALFTSADVCVLVIICFRTTLRVSHRRALGTLKGKHAMLKAWRPFTQLPFITDIVAIALWCPAHARMHTRNIPLAHIYACCGAPESIELIR